MAAGPRMELVGKRFVCVGDNGSELDVSRIHEWEWRAGVIRAVSYKETSNSELSAYVEFDDLEWEKREWVKVYEDFQIFLVEHQLVWAKRNNPSQSQGSKNKQIEWPALTFKSVVGKPVLHLLIAIEFFVDKQLNFIPGDSAFQVYQDDIDSLSPVLRDNPPLHEEVKAWVKEQKVQEIFMQGPYSLNGYRVRVYRQDSATQWFTGIITYHDLLSRTMIVMNDQVLEPQNVDPSMVQMTFLDDVVHSLLKGENIGITSRRRSRSNQNSSVHGHYTRAQANSPRLVMSSQNNSGKQNQQQRIIRSNKRKESDFSVLEEDKTEDKHENSVKEESSKCKRKHLVNKRRKPSEDENQVTSEGLKTNNNSDTESSESENSVNKVILDSSSEQCSENELTNKIILDNNRDENIFQNNTEMGEKMVIDNSYCDKMQEVKKDNETRRPELVNMNIHKPEIDCQQSITSQEVASGCVSVEVKIVNESVEPSLERVLHLPVQKPTLGFSNGTSSENVLHEAGDICSLSLVSQKMEINSVNSTHSVSKEHVSNIQRSEVDLDLNNRMNRKFKSQVNELSVVTERNNNLEKETTLNASGPQFNVSVHATNKISKPIKVTTSPEMLKLEVSYPRIIADSVSRSTSRCRNESSTFQPFPARTFVETTRSPLIIDKNEHFTVYRDPALVGPEPGTKSLSLYLQPHLHPLHTSAHSTCLTTNCSNLSVRVSSQDCTRSAQTCASNDARAVRTVLSHSLHSSHLLPGVLPGVPSPSLVCGHLNSVHARNLSPLRLTQCQQPFLQPHSSQLVGRTCPSVPYNQLGVYPVIWQYSNGTTLSSALSMASSKWIHPENSVSAEAFQRNASSPWHTADDLGLLNHIPVRPASAEPHRPLKLASCSSPPLSKPTVNHQKEKIDKKTLLEWNESVTSAQMKLKLNHDGPSQGMENQRTQEFTNTVLCQNKPKRSTQEQCDSHNKYKEESRRILQESIEVARLASTIKTNKSAKDGSSRMIPLPNESLKPQNVKQDSETKYYAIQLHTAKNSVPHSVPQSNYFTTLSNSIINEPPQLYLSKDAYSEKTNSSSPALPSYNKALSKPPPLIKHQPKGEGTVAKSTGQFSHQVTSQSHDSNASDHRGITEKLPVSSSVVRRGMPSLHRAPVHQHTSHQVADRKEGSSRSLSPPTLTPVLPVNAAKLSESQKPPTLLPEPRPEVKSSMNNHTVKSTNSWSTSAGFLCKPVCHLDNKNSEILQMSPTSVIVRPPSIVKQESKAEIQCIAKDSGKERVLIQSNSFNSKVKKMCTVILPNMKMETTSMEHERNFKAFHPGNNSDSSAVTNSVYDNNPDPSTSQAITTNILSAKEINITSGQLRTFINNSVAESSDHLRIQIEECTIDTISDKVSSADVAGTGATVQGDTGIPNATDYYHLKKHKAALAMAHSGSSLPHNNESASLKSDNSSASLLPKNTGTIGVFCKVNSLTSGQISQSSQPSFHTKLKKAWLTRHSEEDKNTCKIENRETTGSGAKEPITISSSASTTDDVDKKAHSGGVKTEQDEKKTRGTKRTYESGSESDVSDEGESKLEHRVKRQPKPTYKKRQNDLQRRKTETEREEVEMKPNGTLYKNAKEKKSKLQSNGLPRSVLKDWRKVKKLKQTGEPFLQDDSCSEIAPNLQKCRECRMIRYRKNEEFSQSAVFCRFYYFRRLAFSKNAVLRTDGFSTPDQYDDEAINLWLPKYSADLNLDTESSKYILRNIGDTFCQIETSEKTAMTWLKPDAKLAWKRAVKGVQEMCDACEATLFNVHWVCQKCGFVVCLDCYEAKERKGSKAVKEIYVWLKCVKGQVHDPKSLMPTQIIPGSVLTDIGELLHSINDSWKNAGSYPCREQNLQTSKLSTTNGVLQCVLNRSAIKSVAKQCSAAENLETDITLKSCRGDITVDKNKESLVSKVVKVELNQIHKTENHKTAAVGNDQGSTLRDLLTTTAGKLRLGSTDAGIAFAPVFSAETPTVRGARSMPNLLDDIIASVVENKIPASKTEKSHGKEETNQNFQKEIKNLSLDSISKNPSEVPYSWLCEGNVLWLHDPGHPSNCKIFRECWQQEQPVLVSGVHKKLDSNLWKSESFNKEFADQKADLINCKDGSIISSVKMQNFWDGFEDITKRLKSKSGESLLLKLSDWPSGEDFKNMMPSRYDDFMKNLPLPQYCNPEGSLNLASRLPSFFIQPDLGPKLCGVYGRATVDEHGTTNLHLDVADVVNVLVYTGVPEENGNNHGAAILKQTEEEIDENTKSRLKSIDEIPGALWHIFSSKDTNKIREFLQKVNEELGQESSEHDPLHDQVCYLDKKLRQRLYKECGIQCRSILQFLGDTLLIPAGTLRQMQSIYSCIQVSEDFVSPEHIQHAFHLTHELRHQSKDEINYEDKLQIKNVIYHSVKDAVGILRLQEEKAHQKV